MFDPKDRLRGVGSSGHGGGARHDPVSAAATVEAATRWGIP